MYYNWTRGHTQLFWDDKTTDGRQIKLNDLLTKIFGEVDNGTFVEVGAHNGIDCGITTCLADKGWKGVYVEPNPYWAAETARNHAQNPNVQVLKVACGPKSGQVTLFGTDAGATISKAYLDEVASKLSWSGDHSQKQVVPMYPLNAVLEKCKIKIGFEVLSVDVEGYELEVFEGFDLKTYKPKLMMIEMADNHPDLSKFETHNIKYATLRQIIKDAGYVEYYKDIVNSVFLLSEYVP